MINVFTYWDEDDLTDLTDHLAHWRSILPDYAVRTRAVAREALAAFSPYSLTLFDRIRLPACRSDIARLALLERHGGLYVDAHTRVRDPAGLDQLVTAPSATQVVVSTRYAPKFDQIMPHNSMIWARPGSAVIAELLDTALANLRDKAARERSVGHEPYHVWSLSGPGVMWGALFDTQARDGRLKSSRADAVSTIFESDNPVDRHHFIGYRRPGAHWSERQTSERLFL